MTRRESSVGDAHTGDQRRGAGSTDLGQTVGQPVGQRRVTTEVARRPERPQADPPRFDDVETWRDLGDDTDQRLELASITVGVVVDQSDVGATSLSLTAALADDDALGRSSGGTRHDPVRGHDRGRNIAREPRSRRRPVGKPHRDHSLGHVHVLARCSVRPRWPAGSCASGDVDQRPRPSRDVHGGAHVRCRAPTTVARRCGARRRTPSLRGRPTRS